MQSGERPRLRHLVQPDTVLLSPCTLTWSTVSRSPDLGSALAGRSFAVDPAHPNQTPCHKRFALWSASKGDAHMSAGSIRIIGIDPGLRNTGWGIIESEGSRLRFLASGTIRPPQKAELPIRLSELYQDLQSVLRTHQPQEAAVEETFVNKDARATLKLGQARGVAIVAPAVIGISVSEYAANLVKKSVVGNGHADKRQIRAMVSLLLPKSQFESDDAADALAIAICHAHHRPHLRLEDVQLSASRR